MNTFPPGDGPHPMTRREEKEARYKERVAREEALQEQARAQERKPGVFPRRRDWLVGLFTLGLVIVTATFIAGGTLHILVDVFMRGWNLFHLR